MGRLAPIGMLCACIAAGASAGKPPPEKPQKLALARPLPADFDLARHEGIKARKKPVAKRLDIARFPDEIDLPSVEMELMPDGPVFSAGAFGSKRKCRPKLAHVCVDWKF